MKMFKVLTHSEDKNGQIMNTVRLHKILKLGILRLIFVQNWRPSTHNNPSGPEPTTCTPACSLSITDGVFACTYCTGPFGRSCCCSNGWERFGGAVDRCVSLLCVIWWADCVTEPERCCWNSSAPVMLSHPHRCHDFKHRCRDVM